MRSVTTKLQDAYMAAAGAYDDMVATLARGGHVSVAERDLITAALAESTDALTDWESH